MNRLYYGDNLDVLRRHVEDESVDLVYLDPPFNSNANYNVLFAEKDGTQAVSQIQAFEDTWEWDESAARAFAEVVERGGQVSQAMQAFRALLSESDMLGYLAMMAPRLVELRRVLKPTGSIYLHCDPTASHHLKLLLDAVFSPQNFRNEIIWLRSKNPKGSQHGMNRFSPFTDTIFYYARSQATSIDLNRIRQALTPAQWADKYPYSDEHGPYADGPILRSDSMGPRPNLVYEYKGFTPSAAGWRVKSELLEQPIGGALHARSDQIEDRDLRDQTRDLDPLGNLLQHDRGGFGERRPVRQTRERGVHKAVGGYRESLDYWCRTHRSARARRHDDAIGRRHSGRQRKRSGDRHLRQRRGADSQ